MNDVLKPCPKHHPHKFYTLITETESQLRAQQIDDSSLSLSQETQFSRNGQTCLTNHSVKLRTINIVYNTH